MSVLRDEEGGDGAAPTTTPRRRQKRNRASHGSTCVPTTRPRRMCKVDNDEGSILPEVRPAMMMAKQTTTTTKSRPGPPPSSSSASAAAAGPMAVLVLADWLGNGLVGTTPSDNMLLDIVNMLGLLAQAEATMPHHISLMVSLLDRSPNALVRLETLLVLAGVPTCSMAPHLSTVAKRLDDTCHKVRTATLATLTGPSFLKLSKPFVPQIIASLEDAASAVVRTAAAKALVRLGEAGLLVPQDVKTMAAKLRSRSSAIRESTLHALTSLLASTRFSFQAKWSLETALWAQHETVASLVVAREPCGAVRRLGLQFLTTLPRHLCEKHVGKVVQRLGDARPEAQEAALAFLQGNVDPEVLRCHVTALLSLLQHRAASSRCELVVMRAVKLVPERALEPCVGTLVAAVKRVLSRDGRSSSSDDEKKTYARLVQGAALDVLGRMRTDVLLPLVATMSEWVFCPLNARWMVDAVVVAQATVALQRVRNPEIRRACVAHLVASSRLEHQETHYRARALMLLGKRGPEAVEAHVTTVLALLQGSMPLRLRHEAFKVLLVLSSSLLQKRADAIASALCEKDVSWCHVVVDVLRKTEEKKVLILWEAVQQRIEDEKENGKQHDEELLEALKGLVKPVETSTEKEEEEEKEEEKDECGAVEKKSD